MLTLRLLPFFILGSALIASLPSPTDEPTATSRTLIATVKSVHGPVFRYVPDSVRAMPLTAGSQLLAEDVVSTLSSSRVILEIVDGSTVILDSGARMRFRSPAEFHQERGVAYYDITKRGADHGGSLRIRTDFAIAGVKGTEFIINADVYSAAISLNTGELEIESTDDEPFEVMQRKPQDPFEEFKRQRMGGFQDWRKQLVEEFVQYKKSFTLEPGKQVRFNGRRVTEEPFATDVTASFTEFRAMR
jgi:hypothetical protein